MLISANVVLTLVFPPLLASLFLVILLTVLTGGLHLDGLADTFDALGSGKEREAMLAVMRDSSTGVMGILSIVSVFMTKVFVLAFIPRNIESFAIAGMLVTSRWSMTVVLRFFKYARAQGKAREFVQNMSTPVLIAASCVAAIVSAAGFGIRGIALLVVSGLFALGFSHFAAAKFGGITGDVLGAVNEISECVFLIAVYSVSRLGGT
jgi:adenosylcobinamide-GDP ribazoletransferase